MKVLQNKVSNSDKPQSIIHYCTECGSQLEIEENDVYVGYLGCHYVNCPCCNDGSMLSDEEEKEFNLKHLSVDDIQYPLHFTQYGTKSYAVHMEDDEINKHIRRLIDELRNNYDENNTIRYIASGDTLILVQRFDGDEEYWIMVAQNYYDTQMDFTQEDYNNLH